MQAWGRVSCLQGPAGHFGAHMKCLPAPLASKNRYVKAGMHQPECIPLKRTAPTESLLGLPELSIRSGLVVGISEQGPAPM